MKMIGTASFLLGTAKSFTNNGRSLLLVCNKRWQLCCGVRRWTSRSLTTRASSTSVSEPALPQSPPPVTALIFDTETTTRVDFSKAYQDQVQPNLLQLGMLLVDTQSWTTKLQLSCLIQPLASTSALPQNDKDGEYIHPQAQAVHGISVEDCRKYGIPLATALVLFQQACAQADCLVAHNMRFDQTVLQTAMYRLLLQEENSVRDVDEHAIDNFFDNLPQICTMQAAMDVLKLPGKYKHSYKWPSLEESYLYFAEKGSVMPKAHDALGDAQACQTVFRGLLEQGFLSLDDILEEKEKKKARTTSINTTLSTPAAPSPPSPSKSKETATTAAANTTVTTPKNVSTARDVVSSTDDSSSNTPTLTVNNCSSSSNDTPPSAAAALPKPGELQLKILYDTNNNQPVGFMVTGNTFKYKEALKRMGARWSSTQRAWAWTFEDDGSQDMLGPVRKFIGLDDV